METKYNVLFSQLHHPLYYLLHLLNLSPFWAFLSPLSILLSSIVLVIIIYYLCIITKKKPMNVDCLPCCCYCIYFIAIKNLSIKVKPIFNSICTVYKSFFKILWLTKDEQLIKIEHLACYRNCKCLCFIFICFYWQLKLKSITNFFGSICVIFKYSSKIL